MPPIDRETRLDGRNLMVDGQRTSVRLEPVMWGALRLAAERHEVDRQCLVNIAWAADLPLNFTARLRSVVVAALSTREGEMIDDALKRLARAGRRRKPRRAAGKSAT